MLTRHRSAPRNRARRSLWKDEQGGVFVFGIAIALLLVAASWHVYGIGAAAVWGERARDAADAAAFEAAVWHARGMNLVSMTNLMMAVMMALLTFWRMIVTVVTGLSYLCSWPIFPPCAVVQGIDEAVQQADRVVSERTHALLRSLSDMQTAIASLAPALPLAATPPRIAAHFSGVTNARVWSMSLLPSHGLPNPRGEIARATHATNRAAQLGDELVGALRERRGLDVSLPIESEPFDVLCGRNDAAFAWLQQRFGLPFDISLFGPFWSAMTGGDPAFFCRSDAFPPALRKAVRASLWLTCLGSARPWRCVSKRLRRFRPGALGKAVDREVVATSKAWEPFENGSPLAGVSARISLPRPRLASTMAGVALADLRGLGSVPSPAAAGDASARAEFYFDCRGTWEQCRPHATWRIAYRARLRPERALESELPGLSPSVLEAVDGLFSRYAHRPGGQR